MAVMRLSNPGTTSAFPRNMAFTAVLATGPGPVPGTLADNPLPSAGAFGEACDDAAGACGDDTGPPRIRYLDRDQRNGKDLLPLYTAKVAMAE